jgi:Xaa-Pro dipeptidase
MQNSTDHCRYLLTPAEEIDRRITALQTSLQSQSHEAVLLVQNVDIFYFSGTMQAGALFVPATGEPALMIKRSLDRAREESPLRNVVSMTSVRQLPELIRRHYGPLPLTLGMELDVIPVNLYQQYVSLLGTQDVFDVSPLLRRLRSVKSSFEVDLLREAGEIGKKVYAEAPRFIREDITEIELAGNLTQIAFTLGHLNQLRSRSFNGEMFTWHVISGKSGGILGHLDAPFSGLGLSPAFPAGASNRRIERGDPILVDFGICWDGYLADLTRMFSLGQTDSLFVEAYEALQLIEAAILQEARPGAKCEDLYNISLDKAESLGFDHAFLGPDGHKINFVGHGIGLEINDYPFLAKGHDYPLEKGNVFALELKMVFPEKGAVGLENVIAITDSGYEKLTLADEAFIQV